MLISAFDMFPGPLLYNSYHTLTAAFSLNQLSNAYYTLKPLSSSTREQNLRLTEKTPGSGLEKRYREDLAFQAFLYSLCVFFDSSPSISKSVHLRGITFDSIFSSQDQHSYIKQRLLIKHYISLPPALHLP